MLILDNRHDRGATKGGIKYDGYSWLNVLKNETLRGQFYKRDFGLRKYKFLQDWLLNLTSSAVFITKHKM